MPVRNVSTLIGLSQRDAIAGDRGYRGRMGRRIAAICLASLALAGCGRAPSREPIAAGVIDMRAAETIAAETGAGLVRLDGDAQPIAGVALRWSLSDGGRDAIFRIDPAAGLPSATVARRLRGLLRRDDSPLRGVLDRDTRIEAVTDTVVEITLAQEQPALLAVLADPSFAGVAPRFGAMRIAHEAGRATLLVERQAGPDVSPVLVRADRPGAAVLRFRDGGSALVLGGTFAELPVARQAGMAPAAIRFDPATGLFGFAITARAGPYATPEMRQALSLAIDRDRAMRLIGAPGQTKATTIGGSAIEAPLDERRAFARGRVAALDAAPPPLRVALPRGPGATLLFRLLQDDWRRIGIDAIPVADRAAADLRLLDIVVPASARSRVACAAAAHCDPHDPRALFAPPYIPLGAPVRWSLVAAHIAGFTPNALAAHPLDRLRRR